MANVLFLGQKPLGEAAFETLLAAGGQLHVAAAASNTGTGGWWGTRGIYEQCEKLGIPFVDNAARNEAALLDLIEKEKIDLLLSVQHGWILSGEVLAAVGGNALNLHMAPLPGYKGNFAFNHTILNGEAAYAVTLHWMSEKVDEGSVCMEAARPLTGRDTAQSLYGWSLEASRGLVERLAALLAAGQPLPRGRVIGAGGHFYARNSLDGLREVQDANDAQEVDRKARAFWFPPFESAYLLRGGKKYYLRPEHTPEK